MPRAPRLLALTVPLLTVPSLLCLAVFAVPGAAAAPATERLCTPPDELGELSGLASDGERWYATNDGGDRIEVLVLDRTCAVVDRISANVDPYDVEDLAITDDGTLWVADAGDNDLDRQTVAVHKVTRDGKATLYRLTYPDGPRDSEAILVGPDGVPFLVSKEPLGPARVYRPEGEMTSPGPSPLEEVASVQLGPTDTPGGPIGRTGSSLVTGGAMSPDGSVLALRTYTDAYLFKADRGKVASALRGKPVRIPLPNEPQGEAVALEPDGTLLSGSEGGGPLTAIRGAAAELEAPAQRAVDPPGDIQPAADSDTDDTEGLGIIEGAVLAIVLAAALMGLFSVLRRLRSRRRSRRR